MSAEVRAGQEHLVSLEARVVRAGQEHLVSLEARVVQVVREHLDCRGRQEDPLDQREERVM